MSLAHQIGLASPFEFVTGHSLWIALLICWAIIPGMHIALGLVLESRLIPLSHRKQFLGFMPGALFLGAAVAAMSQVPLKDGPAMTSGSRDQLIIAIVVAIITIALVGREISSGLHPWRQILSPVGFYHSFIGGYGCFTYIIFSIAAAVVTSADWSDPLARLWVGATLVFIVIFLRYVKNDGGREFDSSETYIEGWNPFWRLWRRRH